MRIVNVRRYWRVVAAHEAGEAFHVILEVSDGGAGSRSRSVTRAVYLSTDAAAEIEMDRDVLGSFYLEHRADVSRR